MVIAIAVLLMIWGSYITVKMPVDVFPDLTAPTVTILADADGMAPQEIETVITLPIETALNGASGVRRIRSSTSIGATVIYVEFEWGTDIYRARQIVAEKLQLARSHLPANIKQPVLAPVSSIMGEIMFISLNSSSHDSITLKTTADWVVRRRLLSVKGVAQVIPIGGDTKQYQVMVRPDRLNAYGISVNQVIHALEQTNQNTSAGFFVRNGQEFLIYGLGRIKRVEDIGKIYVTNRKNQPIRISDIAYVQIGPVINKRGIGSSNGQPAVVLAIQKQPNVNTLVLTQDLDETIGQLQKSLPAGMTINSKLFRQADFIQVAVDNVVSTLQEGAFLVLIIVFVFLISARATIITLLAIPLSLITSILVLSYFGASINTMTLGGMAIAIGALVDDAIIDVENIVRRLKENNLLAQADRQSVSSVVLNATYEIQGSIVFATIIIILVFIPLYFLTGIEGRLLKPLGIAYSVSLAASLLVAVTLTPVLCAIFLPNSRQVKTKKESVVSRWLKAIYKPFLSRSLHHWKLISLISLLLIVAAGVLLGNTGQSFLPDFQEGSLTIAAETQPGTSLKQSNALGQLVEKTLLAHPEVVSTARRTGRAELAEHTQDVNVTEVEVSLKMQDRTKQEFLKALRNDLNKIPGMNIVVGQPISHRIDHMLSGTRASLVVKIFGDNLYELRKIAKNVKTQMQSVAGVVDLNIEQQVDIPLITIKYNYDTMAQYGLRTAQVSQVIETAFSGRVVSSVLEGQASFDLIVRYPKTVLKSMESIRATRITTASGAQIPLHAVADIRRLSGPNTISRENVQRKIVVYSNVAGRDLRSVLEDIKTKVSTNVNFPTGYTYEYGGQFKSAEQAQRTLLLIGSLVLVAIYLLLATAFGSGRDAMLVMINLPLALIGGVVGVYASGGILSIASIVGFITLFGIATRNGVMLISHIRHLIKTGVETDAVKAVYQGAMERLIPILMTALAAGLALIPLALSGGQPGSEIQTPMAIVILFGLLTSTALNMIALPALYLRFGSIRNRRDTKALNQS